MTPRTHKLTVGVIALILGLAIFITQGCTRTRRGYSFSEIKQMPQFTATVTDIRILDLAEFKEHPRHGEKFLIVVGLKTSESVKLSILQHPATSNHAAFARQLTVGRTYTFPEIIPDFEKSTPKPSP